MNTFNYQGPSQINVNAQNTVIKTTNNNYDDFEYDLNDFRQDENSSQNPLGFKDSSIRSTNSNKSYASYVIRNQLISQSENYENYAQVGPDLNHSTLLEDVTRQLNLAKKTVYEQNGDQSIPDGSRTSRQMFKDSGNTVTDILSQRAIVSQATANLKTRVPPRTQELIGYTGEISFENTHRGDYTSDTIKDMYLKTSDACRLGFILNLDPEQQDQLYEDLNATNEVDQWASLVLGDMSERNENKDYFDAINKCDLWFSSAKTILNEATKNQDIIATYLSRVRGSLMQGFPENEIASRWKVIVNAYLDHIISNELGVDFCHDFLSTDEFVLFLSTTSKILNRSTTQYLNNQDYIINPEASINMYRAKRLLGTDYKSDEDSKAIVDLDSSFNGGINVTKPLNLFPPTILKQYIPQIRSDYKSYQPDLADKVKSKLFRQKQIGIRYAQAGDCINVYLTGDFSKIKIPNSVYQSLTSELFNSQQLMAYKAGSWNNSIVASSLDQLIDSNYSEELSKAIANFIFDRVDRMKEIMSSSQSFRTQSFCGPLFYFCMSEEIFDSDLAIQSFQMPANACPICYMYSKLQNKRSIQFDQGYMVIESAGPSLQIPSNPLSRVIDHEPLFGVRKLVYWHKDHNADITELRKWLSHLPFSTLKSRHQYGHPHLISFNTLEHFENDLLRTCKNIVSNFVSEIFDRETEVPMTMVKSTKLRMYLPILLQPLPNISQLNQLDTYSARTLSEQFENSLFINNLDELYGRLDRQFLVNQIYQESFETLKLPQSSFEMLYCQTTVNDIPIEYPYLTAQYDANNMKYKIPVRYGLTRFASPRNDVTFIDENITPSIVLIKNVKSKDEHSCLDYSSNIQGMQYPLSQSIDVKLAYPASFYAAKSDYSEVIKAFMRSSNLSVDNLNDEDRVFVDSLLSALGMNASLPKNGITFMYLLLCYYGFYDLGLREITPDSIILLKRLINSDSSLQANVNSTAARLYSMDILQLQTVGTQMYGDDAKKNYVDVCLNGNMSPADFTFPANNNITYDSVFNLYEAAAPTFPGGNIDLVNANLLNIKKLKPEFLSIPKRIPTVLLAGEIKGDILNFFNQLGYPRNLITTEGDQNSSGTNTKLGFGSCFTTSTHDIVISDISNLSAKNVNLTQVGLKVFNELFKRANYCVGFKVNYALPEILQQLNEYARTYNFVGPLIIRVPTHAYHREIHVAYYKQNQLSLDYQNLRSVNSNKLNYPYHVECLNDSYSFLNSERYSDERMDYISSEYLDNTRTLSLTEDNIQDLFDCSLKCVGKMLSSVFNQFDQQHNFFLNLASLLGGYYDIYPSIDSLNRNKGQILITYQTLCAIKRQQLLNRRLYPVNYEINEQFYLPKRRRGLESLVLTASQQILTPSRAHNLMHQLSIAKHCAELIKLKNAAGVKPKILDLGARDGYLRELIVIIADQLLELNFNLSNFDYVGFDQIVADNASNGVVETTINDDFISQLHTKVDDDTVVVMSNFIPNITQKQLFKIIDQCEQAHSIVYNGFSAIPYMYKTNQGMSRIFLSEKKPEIRSTNTSNFTYLPSTINDHLKFTQSNVINGWTLDSIEARHLPSNETKIIWSPLNQADFPSHVSWTDEQYTQSNCHCLYNRDANDKLPYYDVGKGYINTIFEYTSEIQITLAESFMFLQNTFNYQVSGDYYTHLPFINRTYPLIIKHHDECFWLPNTPTIVQGSSGRFSQFLVAPNS